MYLRKMLETVRAAVHAPYSIVVLAVFSLILGALPTDAIAQSGGAFQWQVTERPPELVNPKEIDLSTSSTSWLSAWDIHCAGKVYEVELGDNEDAVLFMSGDEPLRFPLRVRGGRNVRLIGIQIDLVTQPGCDVGELPNRPIDQHPNSNIHPRIPGAIAVRLEQSGTSFVEGVYIDMRGHQADCFVTRNPSWMSGEQARRQRHVIVQNSACHGNEGMGEIDGLGDGVHGDLIQNQAEALGRLVFENFTHRQSQNGVILQRRQGFPGAKEFIMRRFDYSWDRRYVGDDKYERFGLAVAAHADNWDLEDVYIDDYRDGGDYVLINDQRYGVSPNSNVEPYAGIKSGLPSQGPFAPAEHTGVNYVSPHDGADVQGTPAKKPNPPSNLAAN